MVDRAWIEGPLEISPVEQIRFLRALHERRLPVSREAVDALEPALARDRQGGAVLYAKTGTGMQSDTEAVGWYVGYIVKGDATQYFALKLVGADLGAVSRKERIARARRLLARHGVWPSP